MGLSLSTVADTFFRTLFLPFFCSTRAASILPPRPYFAVAAARSDGQGRRFFSAVEGLSLTIASTAANCRGRVVCHTMTRGEPAIGREQSREPRLYSVEPVWGPDHEAVIRFCGQGSEAAGPFSQRHCSHSRMRIAATSDRHRLPRMKRSQVPNLFILSRFIMLLTLPAAARHRPVSPRS